MPRIEFARVSKTYSRQSRTFFWKYFSEAMGGARADPFYALRDVSFRVEHGESVGIIGPNGAGKSTLLSLIAGLTVPEQGTVRVDGRISTLMELGAGFHPDLTGRENLRVNAALLGYTRQQIDERTGRILEFSELGALIEEPLRTYSQGMMLRLAFSVAIHVSPDILLIDEVMVVGDQDFQRKGLDRLMEMRRAGVILICVSHAPDLLGMFCDRALWIERGRLEMDGPLRPVLDGYRSRAISAAAP